METRSQQNNRIWLVLNRSHLPGITPGCKAGHGSQVDLVASSLQMQLLLSKETLTLVISKCIHFLIRRVTAKRYHCGDCVKQRAWTTPLGSSCCSLATKRTSSFPTQQVWASRFLQERAVFTCFFLPISVGHIKDVTSPYVHCLVGTNM